MVVHGKLRVYQQIDDALSSCVCPTPQGSRVFDACLPQHVLAQAASSLPGQNCSRFVCCMYVSCGVASGFVRALGGGNVVSSREWVDHGSNTLQL